MTVAVATWLKDILPRTPGIVRNVAKREFFHAAREFYRNTYYWQEVVESLYLEVADYTFTVASADSTADVVQILSVEVNNLPIDRVAQRPVGERQTGTPTKWYPTGPDSFEVWPTPDQYDGDFLVRVALVPKDTAATLPDFAYSKHYDALLDGTLGRVYGHPAKPYSNPTLATYHLNRFRDAIGTAAAEQKGGGFAGQNWQYPRFGK